MSSNARPVIVHCSSCDHRFEDWWRSPVDLERGRYDADYLDQAIGMQCPHCGAALRADAIVDGDGVLHEASEGREQREEPTM